MSKEFYAVPGIAYNTASHEVADSDEVVLLRGQATEVNPLLD